jgi:hypothetical protein
MASKRQPKATGDKQNSVLRARLSDLKVELEITKAAFKDELFDWAVVAISAFLEGKCKSLDAAFKESTGGRPQQSYARSDDEAREIVRERQSGEKWEAIAAGHQMKPRQALREFQRGLAIVEQDEINKFTSEVSATLIARLEKDDTENAAERAAQGRKEAETIGARIVPGREVRRRRRPLPR